MDSRSRWFVGSSSRRSCGSAREQHAALLTGRQRRELRVHRQLHLLEQTLHAIVALPVVVDFIGAALPFDHGPDGARQPSRHLLP
jgi:hypothetical protein